MLKCFLQVVYNVATCTAMHVSVRCGETFEDQRCIFHCIYTYNYIVYINVVNPFIIMVYLVP